MQVSGKIALLSVYDKSGIEKFGQGLIDLGFSLYASGGTAKALESAGLKVTDVSSLVGGKAILGHRVVTLSREISAGLLADKNNREDLKELSSLGLPFIDLVCVDMYPLEETIQKEGVKLNEVIELTDIGGPTLLRAAAKGRRIVLSSAPQRQEVLSWLKAGSPDKEQFLNGLAAAAEYEVARYVLSSAKYLSVNSISGELHKLNTPTKYGENPQQAEAAFYADNRVNQDPLGLDRFEHVKGMERSFINMTDIDRLLQTLTHIAAGFDVNFNQVPSIAVGVKHGNACGAGVANDLSAALKKMLIGDLRAIFGGVVMVNGHVDEEAAEILMRYKMTGDKPRLLDGVIAPSFSEDALTLLNRSKLRAVSNPALANLDKDSLDKSRRIRPVRGGLLEQPNYDFILDLKADYINISGKASTSAKKDAVLAWAIGCTSNSNTISIVKDGRLIGNGVGQQDRVGAAQLALMRTTTDMPKISIIKDRISISVKLGLTKLSGSTAYSDSFFPFPDGPELLAKAGVKTILATSGSLGDAAVKEVLGKYGVCLITLPDKTGRGFFMH
jgi:phosphoribosylaminoimidazolecarboxamide formyltransferase / IMP cyclohydrolase